MTRRCLLLSLCMLVIACRREPAPVPTQSLAPAKAKAPPSAGCYVLEWQSPKPLPQYGIPLPHAFELTREPGSPFGGFLIRSRDAATEHSFARWELNAASELELTWSTGFVGFTVTVPSAFKDGASDGVAHTFADVPTPGESAKVRVVRVRC